MPVGRRLRGPPAKRDGTKQRQQQLKLNKQTNRLSLFLGSLSLSLSSLLSLVLLSSIRSLSSSLSPFTISFIFACFLFLSRSSLSFSSEVNIESEERRERE